MIPKIDFIKKMTQHKPKILCATNIPYNENFDCFYKLGKAQVEECLKFLATAKSPQDYAKTVLKMTTGHPHQSEILYGIYKEIGKISSKTEGWSIIPTRSNKNLNYQLEIFKYAFRKSPDIGEFISFARNFSHKPKEAFSLFKDGASELKNNSNKYSPRTKVMFLIRVSYLSSEHNQELSKLATKTAILACNKEFKFLIREFIKNGDSSFIDDSINDFKILYTMLCANRGNLRYKNETNFSKKMEELLRQYERLQKEETNDVENLSAKLKTAKSLAILIDKKYESYTFKNFQKFLEKQD